MTYNLNLDNTSVEFNINKIDQSGLTINCKLYNQSLIIAPNRLFYPWPVNHIDDLKIEHFDELFHYCRPLCIIIGTGKNLIHPALQSLKTILEHQVGYDIMNTYAACRTYKILASEGRSVTACLIID